MTPMFSTALMLLASAAFVAAPDPPRPTPRGSNVTLMIGPDELRRRWQQEVDADRSLRAWKAERARWRQ